MLLPSNLDALELADIQRLLDEGVAEGRSLDYKRDFSIDGDEKKRELLFDISSFANSVGGELIFGVDEIREGGKTTGRPASPIYGIETQNWGQLEQKLEQILNRGVDPRIPGIQFGHAVREDGRSVLVIRIPRSPVGPHVVTFNDAFRIYGRDNSGKVPLGAQQIRDLVLRSDSISERMRRFVSERIARVIDDDLPTPVEGARKLLVHVLPSASFGGDLYFTGEELLPLRAKLLPLMSGGNDAHLNFDGLVLPTEYHAHSSSYGLVTREGTIEGLTSRCFSPVREHDKKYLEGATDRILLEPILTEASRFVSQSLRCLDELGVPSPVYVAMSLVNVRGCILDVPFLPGDPVRKIDRDVMRLPEIELKPAPPDGMESVAKQLRPAMDALANAGGSARSHLYDGNGNLAYNIAGAAF